MITIEQDSGNTLYFEVNNTLPFLLFVASNRCESIEKKWIGTDDAEECPFIISTMTEVGELGTENATAGEVHLQRKGFWDLEVYEQSSGASLDQSLATFLIKEPIKVI